MKFLFISDTHGSVKAFQTIEELFNLNDFDGIYHLGDVLYHGPRNPLPDGYDPKLLAEKLKKYNIKYIRGNCDADVDLKVLELPEVPKVSMEYFGDFLLLLVHGEVFEENDVGEFLKSKNVHFLVHGHTHISKIQELEGKVILNPGSPSLPKGNTPKSVMIIETNDDELHARFIKLDDGEVYMEEKWKLKDSRLLKVL
ncbi:MAG: phosphodiesterase [Fervidobacterium sp.]